MTELKFRAWFKVKNEMFYQLEESPCFGKFEGDRAVSIEDVFFYEKDQFEVMQFTGITDRNGKDIYEGDVIKHKYYSVMWREHLETTEVVKWSDQQCGFVLRKRESKNYEVIGNVYQDKNLIEKGEDQ